MKNEQIENIIKSIKDFIIYEKNSLKSFNGLVIDLYKIHCDNNQEYNELCKNSKPLYWADVPLISSSLINENSGLNIKTEMPFPGIKLHNENKTFTHLLRDTELYKNSIAKSFQLHVLKEFSWVPWINYQSIYDNYLLNLTAADYALEYLAETFHGNYRSQIENYDDFFSNQLIEKYGDEEEEPLTVPTVLIMDEKNLFKLLDNCCNKNIELPLGSIMIIIQNQPKNIKPELLNKACELFGLTSIMIMLCLSEISTNLYATIKLNNIVSANKNNSKLEPEYFVPHWMRIRVVHPDTNIEEIHGQMGAIVFYDLANAWSYPFLITDYSGRIGGKGGIIFEEIKNEF